MIKSWFDRNDSWESVLVGVGAWARACGCVGGWMGGCGQREINDRLKVLILFLTEFEPPNACLQGNLHNQIRVAEYQRCSQFHMPDVRGDSYDDGGGGYSDGGGGYSDGVGGVDGILARFGGEGERVR